MLGGERRSSWKEHPWLEGGPLFGFSQVIGADGVFICKELSALGAVLGICLSASACAEAKEKKIQGEKEDVLLYNYLMKSHSINVLQLEKGQRCN